MPISPLPAPPTRGDPANFAVAGDLFLAALPPFAIQLEAARVEIGSNQGTVALNTVAAVQSAGAASVSAAQAAASAAAQLWVSGTSYAIGISVWSPVTKAIYRRLVAGAGATDPSVDTVNWGVIVLPQSAGGTGGTTPATARAALGSSATGDALFVSTTAATARAALGSSATGDALFVSTTAATARAALGITTTPGVFYKTDSQSVAFTKTAAGALSIKAGTAVDIFGTTIALAAATSIVMPTLTAGTDYAIFACQDGTVRADANFTNPVGYAATNSRMIGGFHYGLTAPGTTVAGGSFATTGSGMIWTQANVDAIAGIDKYSLWDLKFRSKSSDLRAQKGFALTDSGVWVGAYHVSTDTDTNGLSKYNTNIASGTVLPKVPAAFGGNGATTYSAMDWWAANEIVRAYGARMLLAGEFYDAAFGVTENQSIDATASTYPNTQRNAGYTSKYGIEQAAGVHYTWGQDSAGTTATAYIANGGRGQSYENSIVKVLLGGARTSGAYSGSRCSNWNNASSSSYWNVGLRAACDHLILA